MTTVTQHPTEIPAGYRANARGHLVPESTIHPIDLQRDKLVRELVAKAKALQAAMADFKRQAFNDTDAFVSLSAERYEVKLGGAKGNVTLSTFDGRQQVVVSQAENIAFDERLQAAKVLIDECIKEWAKGSDPKIQVLVQQAFETDKEGKINTGRVLALRRLAISDDKWTCAMQAIGESVDVVGTTAYIRFYERAEGAKKPTAVTLDFAAL